MRFEGAGAERRGQRRIGVPGQPDHDGGQGAIQGARGKGGDAGGFDAAVEGLVIGGEAFVVRAVARAMDVEQGHHQAGAVRVATDAAAGLDVFGAGLGLAENDHQPQPGDVEADRDHVGGQGDIDPVGSGKVEIQAPLGLER